MEFLILVTDWIIPQQDASGNYNLVLWYEQLQGLYHNKMHQGTTTVTASGEIVPELYHNKMHQGTGTPLW